MAHKRREMLIDPLVDNNPITLQVLGICSALAVTSSLQVAFVMAIAVTLVTAFSSMFISMIRSQIPRVDPDYRSDGDHRVAGYSGGSGAESIRIRDLENPIGLRRSDHHQLYRDGPRRGVCMKNGPIDSFIDGVGNGLGYGLILMLVGVIRELFGSGSLFGVTILETVNNGGWYVPNGLLLLPPSAFFIIGLIIWAFRTWKPGQVEEREYKIQTVEAH